MVKIEGECNGVAQLMATPQQNSALETSIGLCTTGTGTGATTPVDIYIYVARGEVKTYFIFGRLVLIKRT